jgi:large subunit ribosomal protein L9
LNNFINGGKMKIILLKDIYKVGQAGDVVKVANGYARNYLLPKKFAILATKLNLKKIEKIKEEAEKERIKYITEQKILAEKLQSVNLSFKRKTDENNHLYGSVSEVDISKALKELGFDIKKSQIKMEKHIKELGDFEVEIVFTQDIKSVIKINVEKE